MDSWRIFIEISIRIVNKNFSFNSYSLFIYNIQNVSNKNRKIRNIFRKSFWAKNNQTLYNKLIITYILYIIYYIVIYYI